MWDINSQSFRDRPSTTQEDYQAPYEEQHVEDSYQNQEPEYDESVVTDLMEEEEDEYVDVLNDARLRLEMGKLYELIMKHDIFGDVEADPQAVKTVQKEMRRYAKERMEIMLGMRQEQQKAQQTIVLPFNQLEIDVLKRVASTFSKGATDQAEEKQAQRQAPAAPKKEGLNTIGSSAPRKENKPSIQVLKVAPVQKRAELPKGPKTPIKRNKLVDEIQKNLAKDGFRVSEKDIEIDYKPLDKDPALMTQEERAAWIKQNEARRGKTSADNPNRIPPPTQAQNNAIMEKLANSGAPAVAFGYGSQAGAIQNSLTNTIIQAVIQKHSNE